MANHKYEYANVSDVLGGSLGHLFLINGAFGVIAGMIGSCGAIRLERPEGDPRNPQSGNPESKSESGLVSGEVVYGPQPLDKPADGNVLVCCSQPARDVVIDL